MRLPSLALAAGLLLAAPLSPAAEPRGEGWKSAKVAGLFTSEVPAEWTSASLPGRQTGAAYRDADLSIAVIRYAGARAAYRSPEDYLARSGTAKLPRSRLSVAGLKAQKVSRTYRTTLGTPDSTGHEEWVYQESVLLRQGSAFWLLEFRSRSLLPQGSPRGLDVWRRFLKSFRLG